MRIFNQKGFSLIEMLVAIGIFAIGMAIAIPNFINMGKNNSVKADARQLKDYLMKARVEALKRNSWVTVAYRPANNDYIIFVDDTPDYTYNGGEEVINQSTLTSSSYDATQGFGDGIDIGSGHGNTVSWDTKGMPFSSGTLISSSTIYLKGSNGSSAKYKVDISTGTARVSSY